MLNIEEPAPDELIKFDNCDPIPIYNNNAQRYSNCRTYDPKLLKVPKTWHQIVVKYAGTLGNEYDSKTQILDAVFNEIGDEEMYPVAYRFGFSEDRFLVRQCSGAIDKLFEKNLTLRLPNGKTLKLIVEFNIGKFTFNQISPTSKMVIVICKLMENLRNINGKPGILDLSIFSKNPEFNHVFINLGNLAVFTRVCNEIHRNENFRHVNGLILSKNNIKSCAPLAVFKNCNFYYIDLRYNELSSAKRLCRELEHIKADELYLEGNILLKDSKLTDTLRQLTNNFKVIKTGLTLVVTRDKPIIDIDDGESGYRIDYSNRLDIINYQNSTDWHAVMIPDADSIYTKNDIMNYFFLTVSTDLTDIYPCYYNYINGMHKFLIRQCFDQIDYLVNTCALQIKIPRLDNDNVGENLENRVRLDRHHTYYLLMNIKPFQSNEVEPNTCISMAVQKKFNAIDRILNLENFQNTPGLEDIIINMSSSRILGRVLMNAARKYTTNCVELRLGLNNILSMNFSRVLASMTNLRAIDLGNNWIYDLEYIKELKDLRIKSLKLDGNPLCKKYKTFKQYINDVHKYFPDVTLLDNVDISSKEYYKTQKNFLCNLESYDFVEEFVSTYFERFESTERKILKYLYDEKAIFSLCFSYKEAKATAQTVRRLSKYVHYSRNLINQDEDDENIIKKASKNVVYGADKIMHVLKKLPKMKFDTFSFSCEAIVFNESMRMIVVSGVFMDEAPDVDDVDIIMAFTRTFNLIPTKTSLNLLKNSTEFKIVNDHFHIYNPTKVQIKECFKYYKNKNDDYPNELNEQDKTKSLITFRKITTLKDIWCRRCLTEADWNFEKALEIFLDLHKQSNIPKIAFL